MALTLAVMLVATLLTPAISFAGDRYGGQRGYRSGSHRGYRSGFRSGSYNGYRSSYGRGGYGYGGYGEYRHHGHNFGETFLGTTLGIITGGMIYNALTPAYIYAPPPNYQSPYQPAYNQPSEDYPTPEFQPTSDCQPSYEQPRYRQPANRRHMCSKVIENGYWEEDCEGNQYWVQTGADRKLIVPCD